MSSRMPPRYLPTLTEIVDPLSIAPGTLPATPTPEPIAEPAHDHVSAAAPFAPSALPATASPDKQALAQQLIKLVRPQLEAELRTIAQELFEAQFSALLPSMHLHIEEAVREAIEQALPEPPEARY